MQTSMFLRIKITSSVAVPRKLTTMEFEQFLDSTAAAFTNG